MMIITLLFTYNSRITTQYLEQNMTLCECLRRCTEICNESRVTCMKNCEGGLAINTMSTTWSCKEQYDTDETCHNKRNGGKLHGNISRNGYGNAMVWWLFWGRYLVGVWYRRKCAVLERLAMVEGRKVHIIHGINISHKELTYLLQKFISPWSKVLLHMPLGDRLVGKDHRSSPTATHKEDNQ